MEERRRAIAQQQERIATSQSGQAGLAVKKISLVEELSRLKAERPGLAAEYDEHKSDLDAKAKEIDAKRVEGLAEDRGVEGTLKQGKGPVYRQRQVRARDAAGPVQDQAGAHQGRAEASRDGGDAHRPDRARAFHHRRRSRQAARARPRRPSSASRTPRPPTPTTRGAKLDPARVLPAFERARTAFRQQPDTERLGALQLQCTQLGQRDGEHAGHQGQGARHRLRSQAGGGGGRARVRAQCRRRRVSGQLRRRRQDRQAHDHRRACWASAASACRTRG